MESLNSQEETTRVYNKGKWDDVNKLALSINIFIFMLVTILFTSSVSAFSGPINGGPTGGNASGILGIVNGGTGASSSSTARSSLGSAASGSNYDITSLLGLGSNSIQGTTALNLLAGGSSQNITLTPSGNGYDILNGEVGIDTSTPANPLTVNGIIQTTSGGVMFPDGSVQTTAE